MKFGGYCSNKTAYFFEPPCTNSTAPGFHSSNLKFLRTGCNSCHQTINVKGRHCITQQFSD